MTCIKKSTVRSDMFPDELITMLDYCSTIKAWPGETDGMVMETSVVAFLL